MRRLTRRDELKKKGNKGNAFSGPESQVVRIPRQRGMQLDLVGSIFGDRGDGKVLVISIGINAVLSKEVLLHDRFISSGLLRFRFLTSLAESAIEAKTDENDNETTDIVGRELGGVNVELGRIDRSVGRRNVARRRRLVPGRIGLGRKPGLGGAGLEFVHDGGDGEGDVGQGQEHGRRDLKKRSRTVLEDRKDEDVVEDVDEEIDQDVDHNQALHAQVSIGSLSNEALHSEQELLGQLLKSLERVRLDQHSNGQQGETNQELEGSDPSIHQIDIQIGSLESNFLEDVRESSGNNGQEEHDSKARLSLFSRLGLLQHLGNQSQNDTSNNERSSNQVSPSVANVDSGAENLDDDSKTNSEREEHGEGNSGLNQKLLQGSRSSSSSANLQKLGSIISRIKFVLVLTKGIIF